MKVYVVIGQIGRDPFEVDLRIFGVYYDKDKAEVRQYDLLGGSEWISVQIVELEVNRDCDRFILGYIWKG